MYGYICTGGKSSIFIFAVLLTLGQLLKESLYSHRSKVFLLRVDSFFEDLYVYPKSTN